MKLQPYPFCGGKRPKLVREILTSSLGGPDFVAWFVRCQRLMKCGAVGPQFEQSAEFQQPDPRDRAIVAWNKRVA